MPNADKLKQRMFDMGISQAELAAKIGIAAPTMCQKINNLRPFYLEEAEKVAAILEIKNEEFGAYFFTRNLRNAISGGT